MNRAETRSGVHRSIWVFPEGSVEEELCCSLLQGVVGVKMISALGLETSDGKWGFWLL